ncbi:hypothetical protein THAOC_17253 [Thalassiosira oceanica]|uniref:Uncharacterized protein n=1 Tax=Thalassiosira oceanica TaxID=159749 RepID=K0SMJ9_THAOC|nr:hypothetical protein THAOC_17253 [Thalassiosira oceanica]|eukprot:EJK62151.1 hypothetical protein THAOC_17253 [Thalassiosira oceanica]
MPEVKRTLIADGNLEIPDIRLMTCRAEQEVTPHEIWIQVERVALARIYEFEAPSFRVALQALEVAEAGAASAHCRPRFSTPAQ